MRFTLYLAGSLLLAGAATAQDMGNARYGTARSAFDRNAITRADPPLADDANGMTLQIRGLLNVLPTKYVAVFNVLQIGPTQLEAERLLRERLGSFTRGLRAAGFDTTTFRTDVISLVPRYETEVEKRLFSKRYNEVPAGFELQKTISIPYPQAAQLNTVLQLAGPAEIYDLVKVDVFVPDALKSREELRTACLAAFKTKEKAYIAAGIGLDTLRKTFGEADATIYPSTRYSRYQAASRPSFEALRKGLLGTSKVNVTEAAQNTVYYYDPVAYDQYDVVLNPVVTQPVVQYSYTFTVRYQPRRQQKSANKYYYMNGNGQMTEFRPE